MGLKLAAIIFTLFTIISGIAILGNSIRKSESQKASAIKYSLDLIEEKNIIQQQRELTEFAEGQRRLQGTLK